MSQFMELGGAGYAVRTQVRPAFVRAFAATLLTFALLHAYAVRPLSVNVPQISFKPAVAVAIPAPTKTSAIATKPSPTPTAQPAVASMPNCTPASYALPTPLDLTNSPSGLTQVIDAAQHYQIYGYSGNEISQQISKCAPHTSSVQGTYTAYTSYTITWQYSYHDEGTGTCILSNAKIGLHQNQIFPQWQAAGSKDLQSQWQSFMSGLIIHEDGQVSLNEQYANEMLTQLQSFPATNCTNITAVVNAQMNADLAELNTAHQTYENQTNYGATQGAILP